jgi:ATP-dependent protease ClpP protease subunit
MSAPAPPLGRPRAGTSAEPVDIHVFDEIGPWGVTAADFATQLRAANGAPVVLHLASPGGSVDDGVSIYGQLRDYPGHKVAYVNALAASIASIIMLGADERIIAKTGEILVHEPWTTTSGTEADHRAAADLLARYGDKLGAIYAERTGQGSVSSWRKTMRSGDTWYAAEQAVAAGLAHRVGSVQPVSAAARSRLSAVRSQYRTRAATRAAVRTATNHALVAAARRARTPDVAELVREGVRDGMRRPNLSELIVAALRDGTR